MADDYVVNTDRCIEQSFRQDGRPRPRRCRSVPRRSFYPCRLQNVMQVALGSLDPCFCFNIFSKIGRSDDAKNQKLGSVVLRQIDSEVERVVRRKRTIECERYLLLPSPFRGRRNGGHIAVRLPCRAIASSPGQYLIKNAVMQSAASYATKGQEHRSHHARRCPRWRARGARSLPVL